MSMQPYHLDPGDPFADITNPDTYVRGVPHATFQRLPLKVVWA